MIVSGHVIRCDVELCFAAKTGIETSRRWQIRTAARLANQRHQRQGRRKGDKPERSRLPLVLLPQAPAAAPCSPPGLGSLYARSPPLALST